MSDEVLWIYKGQGAFFDGVPARNLTAADLDRMSIDDLTAVEHSGLYRRAPRKREEEIAPPEPEPKDGGEEDKGEAAPKKAAKAKE